MTRPPADLAAWRVVSRKLVGDHAPWLQVWREAVALPDGRVVDDYHTIEKADHVQIVAVRDDGRALFFWHYKHGPRAVTLGMPAGHVDAGEAPEAAARRELREEAGIEAGEWLPLGSFVVDANRGAGRAHMFLATQLREVAAPDPTGDLEEHRPVWLARPDAEQALARGDVRTLSAAACLALALRAWPDAHDAHP